MRKNVANQKISAQLVNLTDGSPVTTGTTTVAVSINGGAHTALANATHIGKGQWVADTGVDQNTNGAHLAFVFENSAAVSVTVNAYTDVWDSLRINHQIADSFGESVAINIATQRAIGAETWDITASNHEIPGSVGALLADTYSLTEGSYLAITGGGVAISTATQQSIADELLKRDVAQVQATAPEHSVCAIVLATLESAISGTTWTIRQTGGSTFLTKTLQTNPAAEPVVGVS